MTNTVPAFHGADVSNHQGSAMVAAWDQVVELGGTGGWWKITEGKTYLDPYGVRHREATQAAGLRYRGPYHWLSPTSPVADQFAWFARHVGDLRDGECIQLDIEDPAGLSDARVAEAIDRWEARYPGRVLHYMGRFYMRQSSTYLVDRMTARYGAEFRWWVPWYGPSSLPPGLPVEPVVWQWAGGATGVVIQGVGHVDSNQIIDHDRLERACGYDGLDPQEDGMTPAQEQQLLSQVNTIFTQLTQSGPVKNSAGEPLTLYFAAQQCADQTLHRPWLAADSIDQIAAAVVAALPPGATNLTVEQVTAACNAALWDDTAGVGGQQAIIRAVQRNDDDTSWVARRS